MIKNLTPHAIVVENGTERLVIEPSGLVARIEMDSIESGIVARFPVVENVVKYLTHSIHKFY